MVLNQFIENHALVLCSRRHFVPCIAPRNARVLPPGVHSTRCHLPPEYDVLAFAHAIQPFVFEQSGDGIDKTRKVLMKTLKIKSNQIKYFSIYNMINCVEIGELLERKCEITKFNWYFIPSLRQMRALKKFYANAARNIFARIKYLPKICEMSSIFQ